MNNYKGFTNFLFTNDEFNMSKSRQLLPIKCSCCNKTFYLAKNAIQRKIKNNQKEFYCSKECSNKKKVLNKISKTFTCEFCGKEFSSTVDENKIKRFCSKSCSRKYSAKFANTIEANEKRKKTIQDNYKRKNNTNKIKICKVCGQEKCLHPEICSNKMLKYRSPNLIKFKFDISKIGSIDVYDEWNDMVKRIQNDYDLGLSLTDICKKYSIKSIRTLSCLHSSGWIKSRTLSESQFIYKKNIGIYDNLTEKELYMLRCNFKFGFFKYEQIKGYNLIEKFGIYHPIYNKDGVSRDHMISKIYGWNNNIPPEIISHPANCEIMKQSNNVAKSKNCSITIEELYKRIELWG